MSKELKTFTEKVSDKASKLFDEIKEHPELAGYITAAFPTAISTYLKREMEKGNGEVLETSITFSGAFGSRGNSAESELMKFSLKANERGSSLSFVPEFEILEDGLKIITADEFDFDDVDADLLAKDISDNKDFIECANHALLYDIFVDGEWMEDKSHISDGLDFDDEVDICAAMATNIITILEILNTYKDPGQDMSYEVPGLGTFKISPIKNGYSVSLSFDKEFKANCKSDKLAEKIKANADKKND
jgi:hypothetical protein